MQLSKYLYLQSIAYLRAVKHSVHLRTLLDDLKFPDLRRASKFTNRETNLFKAQSRMRRTAKSTIKNVFKVINFESHDSAKECRTRMVTALVKPMNLCPITYNSNHQPIIEDYFTLHDLMKIIRKTLNEWHGLDYDDSIESTQQGLNAYVHSHLLFGARPGNNIYLIELVLNCIANKYGYTVEIAPLKNRHGKPVTITSSDSYSGDNYQSVARFINYINKQYKLPVPYGNDSKQRATYQRFMALSKPQQRLFIEAIENSTRAMNLRYHVSFKRYSNHQFLIQDQQQMMINLRIIRTGVNTLAKASSTDTYKIIRVNKNTATLTMSSDTYINIILINNDLKRTSGIPP